MQRQGSVSTFLAAIQHCKPDRRAQLYMLHFSTMNTVNKECLSSVRCSLCFASAVISSEFQSFSRCKELEYVKPSLQAAA